MYSSIRYTNSMRLPRSLPIFIAVCIIFPSTLKALTPGEAKAVVDEAGGQWFWAGEELRISGDKVTDSVLEAFPDLDPPLKRLSLSSLTITEPGFAALGRLTALEELSVTANLTDERIASLATLTHLKRLNLRANDKTIPPLTVQALHPLKTLVQVRMLGVGGHKMPAEILQTIPDVFPDIETLDLNHTFTTNAAAIRAFGRLSHLKKLILGGQPWLDAEGMQALEAVSQIESLNLVHTGEKDFATGMEALRGHPNLRELTTAVRGDQLTDELIPIFLTMPKLEELNLGADPGPMTDQAIVILAEHPNLRVLSLGHPSFTDAVGEALAPSTSLEKLTFSAAQLTPAVLNPLPGLASLREVILGSPQRGWLPDEATIRGLTALTQLETVTIYIPKDFADREGLKTKLGTAHPAWKISIR